MKLKRGEVIRVELKSIVSDFDHYGIYSGNGEVIHFSEKKIRREPIKDFVKESTGLGHKSKSLLTPSNLTVSVLTGGIGLAIFGVAKLFSSPSNNTIIEVMKFDPKHEKTISLENSYTRACELIGKEGYDVLSSNCEHFAVWCRTGKAFSTQAFGNESNVFQGSLFNINIPRNGIGVFFNKLGMKRSYTVDINDLI